MGEPQRASAPVVAAYPDALDLNLWAIGDIDHDGRGDLAASRRLAPFGDGHILADETEARSGRDLGARLWTTGGLTLWQNPLPDITGDGLADFSSGTGTIGGSSYTYASCGLAEASHINLGGTFPSAWRSGADGRLLGQAEASGAWNQTAVVLCPAQKEAQAGTSKVGYSANLPIGGGRIFGSAVVSHHDGVYAAKAGVLVGRGDADYTYRILDIHGSATSQLIRDEPDLDQADWALADLFPHGSGFLLLAEYARTAKATVDAPGAPVLATPSLTVLSLDGLGAAWSFAAPPALFVDGRVTVGSDMDGDGWQDVAFDVLHSNATRAGRVDSDVYILSGRDGKLLQHEVLTDATSILLPLGDVDGDGRAESLRIDSPLNGTLAATASAVGLDVSPRWAAPWPNGLEPFNLGREGPLRNPVVSDLNGDGFPDLSSMTPSPAGGRVVEARDGRTGGVMWATQDAAALASIWVQDVTRPGSRDLVWVDATNHTQDDFAGASVGFTIRAGDDGREIFHQALRAPDGLAAQRGGLRAKAVSLGDVDGDGRADFGVKLEEGIHRSTASLGGGNGFSATLTYDSFNATWYVFSGETGAQLGTLTPQTSAIAWTPAAVGALPPAAPIARGESTDAANGNRTPAPGPAFLMTGLLAALLLQRRRRA